MVGARIKYRCAVIFPPSINQYNNLNDNKAGQQTTPNRVHKIKQAHTLPFQMRDTYYW